MRVSSREYTFKSVSAIYKGIEMRSRLEARWAAEFDEWRDEEDNDDMTWEYEPRWFSHQDETYLPDFSLEWRNDLGVMHYVEVEPLIMNPFALMHRMEIILKTYPTSILHIFVGHPGDGPESFICTRLHEDKWYEWIGNSGATDGFRQPLKAPSWFTSAPISPSCDRFNTWINS